MWQSNILPTLFSTRPYKDLHKLELFDSVLCWDWVAESLGTGSAFIWSCNSKTSLLENVALVVEKSQLR